MLNKLFQIEYIKTSLFKPFRVIITLHFLLFIISLLFGSNINISIPGFSFRELYMFPDVWQYFTWIASWFNILLVIIIIILIGNEYNYKTFKQQVINSFDSTEIITEKIISIVFISIYAFLLVLSAILISGFIFTRDLTLSIIFQNSGIILSYLVQTLAFMTIGMLIVFILKNTALSIVIFILYRLLIEPIIRSFFSKDLRIFFPSKLFSNLTPIPDAFRINYENTNINIITTEEITTYSPEPWLHHFLVIVYLLTLIFISSQIIKKQNL
ncbi:hypothetical protein ACFLTE_06975 [Bacteroidota bacterium]